MSFEVRAKDVEEHYDIVAKVAAMLRGEVSFLFWRDPALPPPGVVAKGPKDEYGFELEISWPTMKAFLFGDGFHRSVFDTFDSRASVLEGPWGDVAKRNGWLKFCSGASSPEELRLRLELAEEAGE